MPYELLRVQLTGTLEVFDSCTRSKEKVRTASNKTYTRGTNMIESIFMETTGTLLESLFSNSYLIGVVDDSDANFVVSLQ